MVVLTTWKLPAIQVKSTFSVPTGSVNEWTCFVAEQSDCKAAKGKYARKEVGLSFKIKQAIYFRTWVLLVIGKISMVRISANLGGAHSLLPENRGAKSVELQAEVLQHEGSKLSAWTQLSDISHGFEMLLFRRFS